MRQVRANLIRHVGGRPSATQKMLIERAVTLTGYLARLDAEALSPAGLSDHRRREYLAADGALRRVRLPRCGLPLILEITTIDLWQANCPRNAAYRSGSCNTRQIGIFEHQGHPSVTQWKDHMMLPARNLSEFSGMPA
jgi:hypothetical protein